MPVMHGGSEFEPNAASAVHAKSAYSAVMSVVQTKRARQTGQRMRVAGSLGSHYSTFFCRQF